MKIIEMDQWSSTGDVKKFSFAQWESDEAFNQLKGGDSEAAKQIGIGRAVVREVNETDRPSIGTVWFKCGPDGSLEYYKSNYDTSG